MRESAITSPATITKASPQAGGVRLREAVLSDVAYVWGHLWKRGKVELDALGFGYAAFVTAMRARIAEGRAVTYFVGNEPVAILAWRFTAPGVVTTYFQATREFDQSETGMAVTRAMRDSIGELAAADGIREIVTHSLCVDERAPAWFRAIGMREDKAHPGLAIAGRVMRTFIRRT